MTIKFLIEGNPFDQKGNPTPYTRTTQAGARNPNNKRYQRYVQWTKWVQAAFLKQNPDSTGLGHYGLIMFRHGKPILLSEDLTATFDVQIYWADKKGGDGDNVYKGILDALVVNDKWVNGGSYKTHMAEDGKGKVEVQIDFFMFGNTIADNLLVDVQGRVLRCSNEIVRELARKKFKALSPKQHAHTNNKPQKAGQNNASASKA